MTRILKISLLFLLLGIFSCGGLPVSGTQAEGGGSTDDGGEASAPTTPTQIPTAIEGLEGYVQKGPFIRGSSITIQELDDDFNSNGTSY